VIEYIEEEQGDECMGVDIYSSKTVVWIYKSKWEPNTCVTFERSEIVYLNGCLHIMDYSQCYILAVDIEGEIWRKIPSPRCSLPSIHEAQGHLCVCTLHGRNMSNLKIWILEDYGTSEWTLKHDVSTLQVFAKTNVKFGYLDVVENCSMVHLEWNLLLFVGDGEENDIITYNMDNRKVHVIPTHYRQFLKYGVLPQINYRPYYLPYVPLFLELESLAEE